MPPPGRSFERVARGFGHRGRNKMPGKSRKTLGLAASLMLAGAAIFSTAASAQYGGQGCWEQVQSQCTTQYQAWGYGTEQQCAQQAPCLYCPRDGHDCFEIDWFDDDEV